MLKQWYFADKVEAWKPCVLFPIKYKIYIYNCLDLIEIDICLPAVSALCASLWRHDENKARTRTSAKLGTISQDNFREPTSQIRRICRDWSTLLPRCFDKCDTRLRRSKHNWLFSSRWRLAAWEKLYRRCMCISGHRAICHSHHGFQRYQQCFLRLLQFVSHRALLYLYNLHSLLIDLFWHCHASM